MSNKESLKRSLDGESDELPNKKRITVTTEDSETSCSVIKKNFKSVEEPNLFCLQEKDAGITEYISQLPGFSGVIKERYSDFLVNEIAKDGTIVKLTDLSKPATVEPCMDEEITAILNNDELSAISELQNSKEKLEPVKINVTDKDKDSRRKIHEAIRMSFAGLDSTTENIDSVKYIVVTKGSNRSRRNTFRNEQGNYTHFVLYKENKDTMEAINKLASLLRVSAKCLTYAGTKDKRAKTSQVVSAYRISAEKLHGLNQKMNFMKIGNIVFKATPIKLGDLSGNKFTVIMRQVKGEKFTIDEAMASLSSKGFLNYFGMQRFGTTSVPTHHIGRALLRGEWQEAINLILQPRSGEDQNISEARRIWFDTKDAKEAFNFLRYKGSIEGHLLKGLSNHKKNDLVNALNEIPRNIRLMYIHSYQSYIWNKVLSRRIKEYGLKVIIGDLLYNKEDSEVNPEITEDSPPKILLSCATDKDLIPENFYDVVLPLPGHNIQYPDNNTKDFFEEYLKEDGMTFDSFKSKVKSYSLSGTYRKMVVKPTNVSWELIPYDDSHQALVMSDYDILLEIDPPQLKDGSLNALKIVLQLPPSSYATMAIREISKMDTSKSVQSFLTCQT